MARQHVSVHLDEATIDRLKARASIEPRSIDSIVVDAIHEYADSHDVSREQMLAMVRDIVREDASLLKALGDA